MQIKTAVLLFASVLIARCSRVASERPAPRPTPQADAGTSAGVITVQLTGGQGGLGLDDLRYSQRLQKVIAPAARTGAIDLIDPDTLEVRAVGGFSTAPSWDGSDQQGVQSADEGRGLLFGNDRQQQALGIADPSFGRVVATVQLDRTEPDYVRWAESTSEVWVTQPGAGRIDVLALSTGASTPVHSGYVNVPDGPEGLAIDNTRGHAYVHAFNGDILVIDLRARMVIAHWPTGCGSAHGIPIVDEARGFVFAGCSNARIAVLDADHDGRILDSFALDGGGATILAYAPKLGHFYLRGDPGSIVATLEVSADGKLSMLGTVDVPERGHCMTADDRGHYWVCDWAHGSVLRFTDPSMASPR
jgi:hypothetical protein